MKKNQLTTIKSTAVILGKTKNIMNITKKILEDSNKGLAKAKVSQDLSTHDGITIIGDLMWEKESKEMNWDDGMEYAKNLRLGGYDDWRLPTIEELLEIVINCGGVASTWDDDNWEKITENNISNEIYQTNYKAKGFMASNNYWSSSIYKVNSDNLWHLSFSYGRQYLNPEYFKYYVRCVRGG